MALRATHGLIRAYAMKATGATGSATDLASLLSSAASNVLSITNDDDDDERTLLTQKRRCRLLGER